MSKHKAWLIIYIFAALMTASIFLLIKPSKTPSKTSLLEKVEFYDSIYQLSYTAYHDTADDKYYLFLPSYTSINDLTFNLPNNTEISLYCDGVELGDSFAELQQGQDVEVTLHKGTKTEVSTLQILQCENLPTIYIETTSGSMDKINQSKNTSENMAAMLINEDGSLEYSGAGEISSRGNSTFGKPKSAYNLNFSSQISAWDFDEIDKLCLLANYYDESSLRNLIGLNTAKQKGIDYTSSCQMVNLYANGEYLGLYGVATKQEYEKYIDEDGIVAAFEFTDELSEADSFRTQNDTYVQVIYGNTDDVKSIVEAFENALLTQDYDTAYQYIDIASFANKYAFEDFFCNYDISQLSQYFYIDSNGRIHYMCAWDYDFILGSRDVQPYNNLAKIRLQAFRSQYSITRTTESRWWLYLLKDEYFRTSVVRILETEYDDVFYQELFAEIYDWIDEINASWKCDRIRWDSELKYKGFRYENLEDYALMYDAVICDRSEFLISYLSNPESYCLVEFVNKGGVDEVCYSNICIPYGAKLSDYTEDYSIVEYEALGYVTWRTDDGLSVNDIDIVTEDLVFYNVYSDGNGSGNAAILSSLLSSFTLRKVIRYGSVGIFGLLFLTLIIYVLTQKVSNGLGVKK